jgi:signal transduction histidine kinase
MNGEQTSNGLMVILTALQASMRTVQTAVKDHRMPEEQLVARLREWRRSVEEIDRRLERDQPPPAEAEHLATFYQISQAINSSLDLDVTLDAVMDALIQLTGAERGCLILKDEQGQLSTQVARNFDRGSEPELSRSVIQTVIENGQPVVTTNAQADPRFSGRTSVVDYRLRSIICVPLQVRNRVIGAVYLDNRIQEGAFSEAERNLLTAFANQAATAIENARLYTTTDQALAARVDELTAMQQVDRELNACLDFQRVTDLTLAWAMRATAADAGTLALLRNGQITVHATASNGHPPSQPESELVHTVLQSKQPIAIGGRRIVVPIRFEDRTVGLIDLRRHEGDAFSPDHVELASRLADHAAIAIENARLYEEVRQANQAKSEFVSLVAHELRTPMTSIRGYADILAKQIAGPLTSQQSQFLDTIRSNVERMQILVSDLQDISRIEAGRLKLEIRLTYLEDAMEEAMRVVQRSLEEKGQHLSQDLPVTLPPVEADPARLSQVLVNLLSNASKYGPENEPIAVRAWVEDDFVFCAVSDRGIGMAPEDQAQLFTKFFRSEDPRVREQTGTGLGLCIVKNLVEMQGGDITVETKVGQGSTFTFSIPAAEEVEESPRP